MTHPKPKLEWSAATGKYASGVVLKCGPVMVATVHFDSLTSKNQAEKYRVRFLVPQLKEPEQHYLTSEEAQARAEKGIRSWFSVLELEVN